MGKTTVQILKGTRDFLPAQYRARRKVVQKIQTVFERFGFEPMETPALEYAETLEEKYGEEGERLIYKFSDRGGREVALRYDLTVPLARTMAMYPVEKPFRRYQISPVWRADKPQKGRYREFWQCDADIVGSEEVWADAEVVGVTCAALKEIGLDGFTVRINHRKLLSGIARYGGIEEKLLGKFFVTIDKADKIGWEEVRRELLEDNFPNSVVERTLGVIAEQAEGDEVLDHLERMLREVPMAQEGIAELRALGGYLRDQGVERSAFRFDPALARGLDYYTGPIFETVLERPRIGSISGGGRFNDLIGMFGGRPVPATGTSLGLERIIAVMEELGMLPESSPVSEVLVTVFDRSSAGVSFQVGSELRAAGINAEVYVREDKLKKQLGYAHTKGIGLVIVVGPDERGRGEVMVRDMKRQSQAAVPRETMIKEIRRALSLAKGANGAEGLS
jgi:histidyl-tRNA synthetase